MAINIDDVAQKRSEPLGKYICKFLWSDGDGFGVVMNELPKEVYMDSDGDRIWFVQSDQDEKVYLYVREERLTDSRPIRRAVDGANWSCQKCNNKNFSFVESCWFCKSPRN